LFTDEELNHLSALRSGERIHHFDVLRGFFILLALYQHYVGYLNYWLVYYFRESGDTLEHYYSTFASYVGVRLPMDTVAMTFGQIFIPWVSQIYLTLAAFNLARKNGDDFNRSLSGKLKIYAVIFGFFWLENFSVAISFGHALSFYPIMAWMVILSIIALCFRFFRIWGVVALLLLSFTRFLMPEIHLADQGVSFLQYWIHPDVEYEARLEYFLASGCLGFLLGHFFYHGKNIQRYFKVGFVGSVFLIFPWIIFGTPYHIERLDIFATEHDLAKNVLGTLYILGIQSLVLLGFLYVECRGKIYKVPVVTWVGVSSLLVFGFHRLFFVHIAGPWWAYLRSVWFELPPVNSTIHIWFIMAVYLGLCLVIQRVGLLRLMDRA
jgi:hypothetical protein